MRDKAIVGFRVHDRFDLRACGHAVVYLHLVGRQSATESKDRANWLILSKLQAGDMPDEE